MNRPGDSQRPFPGTQKGPQKPAPVRLQHKKLGPEDGESIEYSYVQLYLIAYNWISAILWVAVFGRTGLHATLDGPETVYPNVGNLLKYTQTFAATEVLNSSFGVVRAGFFTTFIQVASRFVLVWLVTEAFPAQTTSSIAYTTMLLAWSLTETVRYSYFTGKLAFGDVSGILQWLRYNMFILLYPIGILSEVWLIILALKPARQMNWWYDKGFMVVLATYIPGSFILFTHMMAQRSKVASGVEKKKTK